MPDQSTPIRAVLFDYGLVLSGPPDPQAWERMKLLLTANEEPFHQAYWRHRHDYDRGTLTSVAYWQAVASDLNRPIDDDQITALNVADVDLWTQPNQEMIDWAADLQRRGIATGILSNIGDAMEIGVLDRLPWLAAFAHRTFSHRLLLAKPELAIYRRAVEGLRVSPHEILFIDDREENIDAARKAGMTAIQYSNHNAFVRSMQSAGLAALLPAELAKQ
ncbi:MAG: HAD family phosphatase [Acidobacteriota bacterium]